MISYLKITFTPNTIVLKYHQEGQKKAEVRGQMAQGHSFCRSLYFHQTLFPLKGEACTSRNKVEVVVFPSAVCRSGAYYRKSLPSKDKVLVNTKYIMFDEGGNYELNSDELDRDCHDSGSTHTDC